MLTFKLKYFLFFILLFTTEVVIALFAHDEIIRPYIGDLLVVILMYCFIKSFLKLGVKEVALFVLFFAYLVETMQYFNLVQHLGLSNSTLANIIIGNYFTWVDILAYTLGILLVVAIERRRLISVKSSPKQSKDSNVWLFL